MLKSRKIAAASGRLANDTLRPAVRWGGSDQQSPRTTKPGKMRTSEGIKGIVIPRRITTGWVRRWCALRTASGSKNENAQISKDAPISESGEHEHSYGHYALCNALEDHKA